MSSPSIAIAGTTHNADTQLNVRINKTLRERGTAALAEIGFTPSEAVRALWEKAALKGDDLQAVDELLSGNLQESGVVSTAHAMEESRRQVETLLLQMGFNPETSEKDTRSYEELKEAAFLEQMMEEDEGHE